ncbi:hypothetical protein Tco_1452890 [Tanacetum coccineum]
MKKKSELRKSKRLKIDIGRFPFATMMMRTIPLLSPDSPTKEAVDSLIMEDKHLDTIPAMESDEVIKSNLSTFDALSNHSEILSDSNDDGTSSDDDSYENIEYVEASPLNLEYDSLEEVNEDQEEEEFDLEDIFQIQDVILREKLLNISRLVTNIESLKNNPTSDHGGLTGIVISDNSNNPLLELPEFESFHFDLDPSFPRPPPEPPDVEISLIIETDAPVINNFDELNEDECFDPGGMRLMLKMTIPSHLSFGLFSHFSPTLRYLPYFSPPGVKTSFLTPASPLRAGGFSSGWNFHML